MIVLGSSVTGSYAMLLFYDDFVGTRLSYVILNIIKRAVSQPNDFAFNDYPFQSKGKQELSLLLFRIFP